MLFNKKAAQEDSGKPGSSLDLYLLRVQNLCSLIKKAAQEDSGKSGSSLDLYLLRVQNLCSLIKKLLRKTVVGQALA